MPALIRVEGRWPGVCTWIDCGEYASVRWQLELNSGERLMRGSERPVAVAGRRATLGNTFEVGAREWLELVKDSMEPSAFEREHNQLERYVLPELGDRAVFG